MNRKELERYITETYNAEAESPWVKSPEYIVFRHSNNRKWFAVIMTVQGAKLGLTDRGSMDIVNLKCDPLLAGSFRNDAGIYPAYHMNKERWISVALDGSVDDEKLCFLLDMSYELTAAKGRKRKNEVQAELTI